MLHVNCRLEEEVATAEMMIADLESQLKTKENNMTNLQESLNITQLQVSGKSTSTIN